MNSPNPSEYRRMLNFEEPKGSFVQNATPTSDKSGDEMLIKPTDPKPRNLKIDFSPILGNSRSFLANKEGRYIDQACDFRCKFCGSVFKNTSTYLEHLNGQVHRVQRGTSTNIERSIADQCNKQTKSFKKPLEEGPTDIELQGCLNQEDQNELAKDINFE